MLLVRRSVWAGMGTSAIFLTFSQLATAASVSCHNYTATAGDTLIGLSQRFLAPPADWKLLARANHVHDPKHLPVGKVLCIPVDAMKSRSEPGEVVEVVGDVSSESPAPPTPQTRQRPHRQAKRAAPARPGPSSPEAAAAQVVRKGDKVPPGMTLRTSTNGYVTVQLADGSILKVQADTQVRLDSSRHYEEAGFYASIWSVLRGRVESLVTHLTGGQPRYQIKTPQAVLGVRGTEFRVRTDAQRTTGETLTGTVALSSAGHTTLIEAGHGSLAAKQTGPDAPLPLPTAPSLSGVPSLFERPLMRVDLPEVVGADRYRIQIAEDSNFRRIRAEQVSAKPQFRVADLPDGPYFLRARVASAQGLEGQNMDMAVTLKARPEPPIPTTPIDRTKVRAKEVTFTWTTHPQASRYRLQVATDAAFNHVVAEQLELKDTEFKLPLPKGDYHWRLATTAAGSDKGPWGDAQLLLMRDPPAPPAPPVVTPESLQFQLQAEPGQRFEFQMAQDSDFAKLLNEVASPSPQITLPRPAEGGRLFVRYRAIDDDGFVGPYTSPQLVLLPPCVRSGDMQCIRSKDRFVTSRP